MSSLRPRSLSEYVGMFWRRKMLIALTAAVVALAVLISIGRLPNLYESRALVVVSGMRSDEGRQAAAAEITLVTKQLESRTALEPLIKRHGLYPGMPGDVQIERMLKSLKLETKLRSYYPELPEAVAISFRHTDPAVARRVLGDVLAFFIETNEAVSQQAADQVRDVGAKITEVENQLRKSGARRSAPTRSNDFFPIRAERLAAASSVESLEDKKYALERQVEEQKRQIAEQQKLVKAAPPASSSGAQGALLVRKAELEAQLKDYATQYTDKNPKVMQARNQIAEINRQLVQLNAGGETPLSGTQEGRELRGLERDLARMQTELEITQRELGRRRQSLSAMPSVGPSTSTGSAAPAEAGITPNAGYLQNRYVALLDQQDQIQLALAAPIERGLAPFRIVDPPNLPGMPVGPDRNKLLLIGLCAALAIGMAAAAVVEGPRLRMVQNQRDAEYYLGSHVVALIPETLTPDERGHKRRQVVARKLALLALAIAAVPALVALLLHLEIIHRIAFR